jgi:hypothetical protein
MSSRKKPRPLFEVPADIDGERESGWVYRSESREQSGGSIIDTGSTALALGVAAIAQTMMLGLTIAAIPMTLGIQALQSLTRSKD